MHYLLMRFYVSTTFICTNAALPIIFLGLFSPANSFITSIAQKYELRGSHNPLGSIWPRPQLAHPDSQSFVVATSKFEIQLLDAKAKEARNKDERLPCPFLTWAIDHYTQKIRQLRGNEYEYKSRPSNPNLNISKGDKCRRLLKAGNFEGAFKVQVYLQQCSDSYPQDYTTSYEKYTITTKNNGPPTNDVIAVVGANSAQSVMRALESLYQMLWPVVKKNGNFKYFMNSTKLIDFPRFVHRGLMLDTARHFLPERVILKILTGMMYNKLNVFHWHIVDDQSFPFESHKFPELSHKGAYHKNAVYTAETIQRIIKAAGERGIRVIFEFDTPGHAGGIRKSHQEFLTPCGTIPGTAGSDYGSYENLDPSNEKMYSFVRELFTEIVQNVTKDKYVHLGLDEVNDACWASSPGIKKFMAEHSLTRVSQVQEYYTTRHVAMVKSLWAKMIAWQDPLDQNVQLDKDVVIQVWKSWTGRAFDNTYKKILNDGYKVIFSPCWYINYINYGESWREYYECDPYLNGQIPKSQQSQVLGGEAAIWAEFVDATNIIPRIFPFVGAIGSALWDSNIDSVGREHIDDAMFRLDAFRCSMLQRGIAAQPVYTGHCGAYENEIN